MTWWIIIYLGLFGMLSAGGLWDDFRDRRPAWFLTTAVLSNLIIAYLFVAFWYPALRIPLGIVAPIAFLAAMGWELFQAVEDIRALGSDPELSRRDKRVVATAVAIVLPILCVPAFVFAGLAAFRS